MADEDSATNQLLKQMMEQISQLQAQVTALQQKPADPMYAAPEKSYQPAADSLRLLTLRDIS